MSKKRIFSLVGIAIIGIVVLILAWERAFEEKEPPTVTRNFVDLEKIERISKFRSCQGHTVVPQDESESARNMKHYVRLEEDYIGEKVAIKAPFDGRVLGTHISLEEGLEGEVDIGIHGSPWSVSYEHILLAEEYDKGDKVKEGEILGYVPYDGFDVVYSIGADDVKVIDGWASPFAALDSVFLHMSDEVFSEYQDTGINSREDLIYSKAYRDQNPCEYEVEGDPQLNDHEHPEDWVILR